VLAEASIFSAEFCCPAVVVILVREPSAGAVKQRTAYDPKLLQLRTALLELVALSIAQLLVCVQLNPSKV